MNFDLEVLGASLKKAADTFVYTVEGNLTEGKKWVPYTYVITFNPKATILHDDLKTEFNSSRMLKEMREDIYITKNIEMIIFLIHSLEKLQDIKWEELDVIDEKYEYFYADKYNALFHWKEEKEIVFSIQFSKTEAPKFFSQTNQYRECSIDSILSEKMKKMMTEKVKVHSKEKETLLTEGYRMNVVNEHAERLKKMNAVSTLDGKQFFMVPEEDFHWMLNELEKVERLEKEVDTLRYNAQMPFDAFKKKE